MFGSCTAIRSSWFLWGCLAAVAGCSARAESSAPASPPKSRVDARGAAYVRTRGDRFEIVSGGIARPIFFRGVNLGAGAPGHFPGEFAFTKEDYRGYLRFARELHANAIRVYALHPPAFYQALREENQAHPDRPLWLFQEVWTELPDANDFRDEGFTRAFEQEIRFGVDAVHGRATILPRPGHASGRYDADVSPWLAGWLLGREWEPYAVRTTERRHPDATRFRGTYFAVDSGTPMETWLARLCEFTAAYEGSRYGLARAISFVNWPTLDVMRHPTETERGGWEVEHDEDAYAVDPTRIRPIRDAGRESGSLGYFANYHVYPYYPDFMNLDPGYAEIRDRHGPCNYAGYLRDLKAHTRGLPLLIGEYGVPSSRGIAHLQPQGLNHGGASEAEQGTRDVRLLEDIEDTGCAGSLLFALFDEWFKVNWLVRAMEAPRDRDPLWQNVLDPEECYGLIAFDPPPRIRVDGNGSDWAGIPAYAQTAPEARRGAAGTAAATSLGTPLRALYATSDGARLYLRLDVDPEALRGTVDAVGISLDVLDPARGDVTLPPPLNATWSRGAEYVLVLRPGVRDQERRAELFIDRQMNWSGWSRRIQGRGFVPNRAPFRPAANGDGSYRPLLVETNRERVTRSGTLAPAQVLDWGRLERSDWSLDRARGVLEVALPWGLLNVGDPSSRCVIDDNPRTPVVECTATGGIGLLAWATRTPGFRADSLGPSRTPARAARPEDCHYLGPPGTTQTVTGERIRISNPVTASYVWNAWNRPITKARVKESAALLRAAFEGMESRESQSSRAIDAAR